MKYSPEFLETNARLKTLDEETLNDELNNMTTDELWAHGDYMIQQTFKEEDLLSEEEAQAHINELLQLTREPVEEERKPIKVHTHRTAKRILILAAAILVLISAFMVATVASKREFSILNGVVQFENGKIHVQFPKADGSVTMTVTEFEADLNAHGFDNVNLPKYFYEDEWHVKDVLYRTDNQLFNVEANIENEDESYSIVLDLFLSSNYPQNSTFYGAEGAETIQNGDISVYLFDHGDGLCELIYYTEIIRYDIRAFSTVAKMRAIAKTIV